MARRRGGKIPPAVSRDREVKAWTLEQQGVPRNEIAQQLEITPSAVTRILERVERKVFVELSSDIKRVKGRAHLRYERIYNAAMGAWETSRQPRKRSRSKKLVAGGLTPEQLAAAPHGKALLGAARATLREETTNEATTSDGDFRYLQTALDALAAEAKLWGLDAPKQLRVRDETPRRRPLAEVSDEELTRRIAEANDLLRAEDTDMLRLEQRTSVTLVRRKPGEGNDE